MSYIKTQDLTPEEQEKRREKRREYQNRYNAKLRAKAKEIEQKPEQKKEEIKVPDVEIIEEPEEETGNGLRCSCGGLLVPDHSGMYPHICKKCGEEVDYRGVRKLEDSPDILVCSVCGGLTRIGFYDDKIKCRWCGQEFDGVE